MQIVRKFIAAQYCDSPTEFVALDHASDGYPYRVDVARAHQFNTTEDADRYAGPWPTGKTRSVTVEAIFTVINKEG